MRLEDYWGIGPKTSETLRETLGVERAIDAIEAADVRTLVDAGLSRGRATRILRRANGEASVDVLATGDTRSVYDELLTLAASYAVTEHAGDRIRVLTPLSDREAIDARLDDVLAARTAWERLDEADRETLLDAFADYDAAGGTDRAAVEAAIALREAGFQGDTFEALDGLDGDALRDTADALAAIRGPVDGDTAEIVVVEGADEELDRRRDRLEAAKALESSAFDVIDSVRDGSVRDFEAFKSGVVDHVATEAGIDPATIRSSTPDEAVDAADFVSGTLRTLVADLDASVTKREKTVAEELRDRVGDTDGDVDRAVDAVSDIAFQLSLGRFAAEHDLTRPRLVDDGIAVRNARALFVDGEVQPVSYGVGTHGISERSERADAVTPPSGQRVSVLTGANSGGKTTLLETLCSVVLLAYMGLPVPAAAAEVGTFDRLVFHRRHASFNAGVLEATLQSVVPPLAQPGQTLMLVDEFEAITEPGRAADLLSGLVQLTVDSDAVGTFVTHLADDLQPLPEQARIDGISAAGLRPDLSLEVDYQPRFGELGRSTPEFIVSRLLANADDRAERAAFGTLASALGTEVHQRTLTDARWET